MVTVKKRSYLKPLFYRACKCKESKTDHRRRYAISRKKRWCKPLSTAVEELWEEKVKILGDDEEAEE